MCVGEGCSSLFVCVCLSVCVFVTRFPDSPLYGMVRFLDPLEICFRKKCFPFKVLFNSASCLKFCHLPFQQWLWYIKHKSTLNSDKLHTCSHSSMKTSLNVTTVVKCNQPLHIFFKDALSRCSDACTGWSCCAVGLEFVTWALYGSSKSSHKAKCYTV